jgi:reactive intermediate/imine deaminase
VQIETISTHEAPAAIGTYSQAVRAGDTVYISGQIPLDPITGTLIEGTFQERVYQVFENLSAIAKASGLSLKDAVKLTVYLTDLSRFAELNEVMARYFTTPYPARAVVQVTALPRATDIEIDAILVCR